MTDLSALDGATIAFDLDGTLVDSAPDLIGTLNVILQQEGVAPLQLEEARPFIGHGARRLIGAAAAIPAVRPAAMVWKGIVDGVALRHTDELLNVLTAWTSRLSAEETVEPTITLDGLAMTA